MRMLRALFVVLAGLGVLDLAPHIAASPVAPSLLDEESRIAALEADATTAGSLGFYRDRSSGEIVVLMPASVGKTTASSWASYGVPTRVQSSALTADEIGRAIDELRSHGTDTSLTGEHWVAWFDPELQKVRVSGTFDPEAMTQLMGTDSWIIAYSKTGGFRPTTRRSDFSPFFGGALLKNVYPDSGLYYDCSSGFAVKNAAGQKFMLTARHCSGASGFRSPGNGGLVGSLWDRTAYPGNDVMTIGHSSGASQTYAGYIYVSTWDSSSAYGVVNAFDPTVGATGYCHDGVTSLDVCGQQVTSVTAHYCDPPYGCSNNDKIIWTGPSPYVDGGDSGGPFYLPSGSGKVGARGIITGILNNDPSQMVGEKWSRITSLLGVSAVLCGC
jgi:hypothetical protein